VYFPQTIVCMSARQRGSSNEECCCNKDERTVYLFGIFYFRHASAEPCLLHEWGQAMSDLHISAVSTASQIAFTCFGFLIFNMLVPNTVYTTNTLSGMPDSPGLALSPQLQKIVVVLMLKSSPS
jgi:hypothetical protein